MELVQVCRLEHQRGEEDDIQLFIGISICNGGEARC